MERDRDLIPNSAKIFENRYHSCHCEESQPTLRTPQLVESSSAGLGAHVTCYIYGASAEVYAGLVTIKLMGWGGQNVDLYGLTIVPEVGHYNFEESDANADEGYESYFGAKWQINF